MGEHLSPFSHRFEHWKHDAKELFKDSGYSSRRRLVVPMIVSVHEIRKRDAYLCEVASGAILASSVALVSFLCRCYKKKFGAKYEYMFVVCELTFVAAGWRVL